MVMNCRTAEETCSLNCTFESPLKLGQRVLQVPWHLPETTIKEVLEVEVQLSEFVQIKPRQTQRDEMRVVRERVHTRHQYPSWRIFRTAASVSSFPFDLSVYRRG